MSRPNSRKRISQIEDEYLNQAKDNKVIKTQ